MNITKYSKNHIMRLANDWQVPREYFDPIYNYLIHGFEPGSFFSALLANDMFRALASSHPSNTVNGLKNLTGWIRSTSGHGIFWGSKEVVQNWLKMSTEERRKKLELLNLVYSEQDEIMMVLKEQPTHEPAFW